MYAARYGRYENISAWLARFPGWDVQYKDVQFGGTAMDILLKHDDRGGATAALRELLDARARADDHDNVGCNSLICAVYNDSGTPPEALQMLIEAHADVNHILSAGGMFRNLFKEAREAVRAGGAKGVQREWARWEGLTALGFAAIRGKIVEMGQLVDARADPTLRNLMGHTPLELARETFGGALPRRMQERLRDKGLSFASTIETEPPSGNT